MNHHMLFINSLVGMFFLFFTISANMTLYLSPLPILVIKGWLSNLLILHLLLTSFYKHLYTKSHKSEEYLFLFNLYASLVEIKYIAFKAGNLKYGGYP